MTHFQTNPYLDVYKRQVYIFPQGNKYNNYYINNNKAYKMQTVPHYNYNKNRELSIVLAPFSGGQGKLGVEKGPKYLLKHGLQASIEELGWSTELVPSMDEAQYVGKLKMERDSTTGGSSVMMDGIKAKRADMVGEATKLVYDSVSKVAQADRFPLTLGGDHSISLGSVSAVLDKYPDAGLLWIDAHADINTIESTPSGNLHGCPVSFLLGLNKDIPHCPESLKWVPGNLSPKKIAYIGLRDVDAGEKKILKELGIASFSMYHVDKYGINAVSYTHLDVYKRQVVGGVPCKFKIVSSGFTNVS